MPVTLDQNAEANLLIAHFSGKITRADYEKFVLDADCFIQTHAPVRMLVDLIGLEGWELGVAWDDLKFGIKHYSDMTRLAVLADKRWERFMAILWKPFTKAATQGFSPEQRAEAHRWVLA